MENLTLVYLASAPPYLGFIAGMVCGLAFVAAAEWWSATKARK